ncbi:hypothetical protein J2S35_000909 [Falsarthrobacter nasiphocae]|uniref:Uncharacterized protein n=1 Tax=Falsarthrobacter nasiphocae TaxID=189863 RepID=A0AAE4C6Z3_9MICC|nr:hypothetical protein [Falsarthrobacter nasiphocae]
MSPPILEGAFARQNIDSRPHFGVSVHEIHNGIPAHLTRLHWHRL